jgi:hypothetical protein
MRTTGHIPLSVHLALEENPDEPIAVPVEFYDACQVAQIGDHLDIRDLWHGWDAEDRQHELPDGVYLVNGRTLVLRTKSSTTCLTLYLIPI